MNARLNEENGYFMNIVCHERPIIDIRFNHDADLIYTAGKDSVCTLLRTDGEVLGVYKEHKGSIFSIAMDIKSTSLMTGSADQTIIHWDVVTGKVRCQASVDVVVKALDFCNDGNVCFMCNDDIMGVKPQISSFDLREGVANKVFSPSSVPVKILLNSSENTIVYSDTSGYVSAVDLRKTEVIKKSKIHSSKINGMRASRCRSFFITASMDSQSKIVDFTDLSVQKIFACEEPVNCAVVFNTNDKAICVGGINARDVTITKGKSSFDTNFFDVVTCEKIGSYSTHFGTINSVDVHPGGTMYCSGGEEGTISILAFGQDFFKANFTCFD
ncbi:translation initiation factor eIF3 subunit [Ordospora colligata]|uniref:Serine-threonine kinase receptor-associated protein n=1 Tax=Ordospora colligata OC4 TaxID=1354746 RepID=A0A0B2UK39_9MICR|nr:uncharacterized protein M896_050140 [Ordospora colligata OC4]KHN69609.1 hypothetical protein M896_050140 [Ordospora colligata OC4]TBU15728.1 hypothetical protein CWI41_050130 [Ordospora colligata]TBU15856.1 hypothetical protein CWI40_050150 [Ordospora colligata]